MRRSTYVPLVTSVALFCTSVGCHPHVELHAPEANAPGPERVAAYQRLQGTSTHETHITYVNEYGSVAGATRRVDYIQLAEGQRVYHPEDLKPVLADQSAAFSAAERAHKKRRTGTTLSVVGWSVFAVGVGVLFAGIAPALDYENYAPMIAGAGVMVVGSGLNLAGGIVRWKAADEKATAFELYNDGLAMRLNVCQDKTVLVPCEEMGAATPSAAPVSAPAPARAASPGGPPGVAGFEFKMSAAEAQSTCEEGGNTWTANAKGALCSSTAQSIGLEGSVQLLSCGEEFCQILVTATPPDSTLLEETTALRDALVESYGTPEDAKLEVPEACKGQIGTCLDQGEAYVLYEWVFENGQRIKLTLGRSPEHSGAGKETDHKLRLLYMRPQPRSARAL